ncbi:MAG: BTAD domain-containing putative transcriptional regulator [Gallionella sp.]|nr:BTAD domain-containing putative transcriptional regulator [Gallionella sp.]MDD4946088.1 BTAD domain-containing putative transcriptional regulator [Gallionella sp.]
MGDVATSRPLKIYTLGRFSLVRDGAAINFSAKTKKPVELLKTLLAAGGRAVNTDQLCDHLWPAVDGDTAHNSLNVTLYRLRKLLVEQDAILLLDKKLSLNPQVFWVDVGEFERRINGIEAQLKSANPCPVAIRADTSRLLELCNGAFLHGEACPRIIAARNRLQRKFLHLLEALGQHWEKHGNWAHASEFYFKGLEVDPMLESLYQRLMVCHREMGLRAEAMLIYRRCQDALSAHLNLTPSRHTEAIRTSLTAD